MNIKIMLDSYIAINSLNIEATTNHLLFLREETRSDEFLCKI